MKNSSYAVLVPPGILRHGHTLTYFSAHAANKCQFSNLLTFIIFSMSSFKMMIEMASGAKMSCIVSK